MHVSFPPPRRLAGGFGSGLGSAYSRTRRVIMSGCRPSRGSWARKEHDLYTKKLDFPKGMRLALALATLALVATTAAFGAASRSQASDTLVFAGSADPVALDGSLANDGESIRVIKQLVETLVAQAPGATRLVPDLATSWKHTPDGRTWTFTLRSGVKFHDGTPFNAQAVCFNFNRWYNYTGIFQSPNVSYYYNLVFGGFKT